MRSPEEIQRLAQMFWPEEAFTDEATFASYAHFIISEVHKRCQSWDLDGIDDWLAIYSSAESRCKAEPLATPYEHALMLVTLSIADTHAAKGNFATMYVLLEQILVLLREGDERRKRLGLMPRGSSELRYNVFGSLAAAKWQGAAEDRNRLLSVEEVTESFERVAEYVLAYLHAHPENDDGRMVEAIEINGLDVAAMNVRWFTKTDPLRIARYIAWYNTTIGDYLALELQHFLHNSPYSVTWYYWSYEIIKLYFSGALTKESLTYCHNQRLTTVLKTINKPRHLDGLYGTWDTQNKMMLAGL